MSAADALMLIDRVAIGAILVTAGGAKFAAGPTPLVRALLGYDLLPAVLVTPVARVLPATEILVGVCLIAGLWIKVTVLVAIALLTTFTTAVLASIVRKRRHPCGCGTGSQDVGWAVVLRNVIYLGLTVPLLGLTGEPALDHLALSAPLVLAVGLIAAALIRRTNGTALRWSTPRSGR